MSQLKFGLIKKIIKNKKSKIGCLSIYGSFHSRNTADRQSSIFASWSKTSTALR
jgi:hypothetical protein